MSWFDTRVMIPIWMVDGERHGGWAHGNFHSEGGHGTGVHPLGLWIGYRDQCARDERDHYCIYYDNGDGRGDAVRFGYWPA